MKTMLGGWEDVERCLAAERAGRTVSTATASSVSVRRCVPVAARESARPAVLWQSHGPRQTCLGGPAAPRRTPAVPSAPPCPRPAPRRQPPPLPAHLRPRASAPAQLPSAARPPRLDATCEISDLDLIVLAPAAPRAERGTPQGRTRLEPPLAVRRCWLPRLRCWAKRCLRALAA